MHADFADRIAIVTGAASGIGLATARHLAERGARIAGVDRDDRVHAVLADLPGGPHHGVVADLADPAAASAVVDEVVSTVGVPRILVNSAGIGLMDPAVDVPAERWQRTLDVNLSGTFYMAQAAGRVMIAAGAGRIVNIASQAALIALDQHAAYAASKGAVISLTKVLAAEWARHGVTVNAISPTVVDTPLAAIAWAGEAGERARGEIPVGRFAQPEEIAALIAYLASDEAAMVTGANVVIDGGRTIV